MYLVTAFAAAVLLGVVASRVFLRWKWVGLLLIILLAVLSTFLEVNGDITRLFALSLFAGFIVAFVLDTIRQGRQYSNRGALLALAAILAPLSCLILFRYPLATGYAADPTRTLNYLVENYDESLLFGVATGLVNAGFLATAFLLRSERRVVKNVLVASISLAYVLGVIGTCNVAIHLSETISHGSVHFWVVNLVEITAVEFTLLFHASISILLALWWCGSDAPLREGTG